MDVIVVMIQSPNDGTVSDYRTFCDSKSHSAIEQYSWTDRYTIAKYNAFWVANVETSIYSGISFKLHTHLSEHVVSESFAWEIVKEAVGEPPLPSRLDFRLKVSVFIDKEDSFEEILHFGITLFPLLEFIQLLDIDMQEAFDNLSIVFVCVDGTINLGSFWRYFSLRRQDGRLFKCFLDRNLSPLQQGKDMMDEFISFQSVAKEVRYTVLPINGCV